MRIDCWILVRRRIGRDAESPKFVDYEDSRLAMHILNRDRGYNYNDIKEAMRLSSKKCNLWKVESINGRATA